MEIKGKRETRNCKHRSLHNQDITSRWESEIMRENGVSANSMAWRTFLLCGESSKGIEGLVFEAEWDEKSWKWRADDQKETFCV